MVTKVKLKIEEFKDEIFEIVQEDNDSYLCKSLTQEDFEIFVSKDEVEPIEEEKGEIK